VRVPGLYGVDDATEGGGVTQFQLLFGYFNADGSKGIAVCSPPVAATAVSSLTGGEAAVLKLGIVPVWVESTPSGPGSLLASHFGVPSVRPSDWDAVPAIGVE
jgi:hypothetical protein